MIFAIVQTLSRYVGLYPGCGLYVWKQKLMDLRSNFRCRRPFRLGLVSTEWGRRGPGGKPQDWGN